jgi:hypothetical protein
MNKKQALKAIEQINLSELSNYALEQIIQSYCINREIKGCDGCPLLKVNHCREIE